VEVAGDGHNIVDLAGTWPGLVVLAGAGHGIVTLQCCCISLGQMEV
jgi:hypothetical protein